jgi:hypothetical protein
MLNSQNMTTRTGRLGQDNRVGTTVAVEIGHLGQDHSDRTAGTGQPVLDSRFRTAGTGQPGQDSRDKTVYTVGTGPYVQVGRTGEPRKGHDNVVRRAVVKIPPPGQLE